MSSCCGLRYLQPEVKNMKMCLFYNLFLTVLVTSVITTVGIQKPEESGCRMGQILNCINLNGIENHSNSDTQNIQYSNASGIQMFGIGYAEIF